MKDGFVTRTYTVPVEMADEIDQMVYRRLYSEETWYHVLMDNPGITANQLRYKLSREYNVFSHKKTLIRRAKRIGIDLK